MSKIEIKAKVEGLKKSEVKEKGQEKGKLKVVSQEKSEVKEVFLCIFELSHWPFLRGILKNTQTLITQKLLKNNSIFRTITLL